VGGQGKNPEGKDVRTIAFFVCWRSSVSWTKRTKKEKAFLLNSGRRAPRLIPVFRRLWRNWTYTVLAFEKKDEEGGGGKEFSCYVLGRFAGTFGGGAGA